MRCAATTSIILALIILASGCDVGSNELSTNTASQQAFESLLPGEKPFYTIDLSALTGHTLDPRRGMLLPRNGWHEDRLATGYRVGPPINGMQWLVYREPRPYGFMCQRRTMRTSLKSADHCGWLSQPYPVHNIRLAVNAWRCVKLSMLPCQPFSTMSLYLLATHSSLRSAAPMASPPWFRDNATAGSNTPSQNTRLIGRPPNSRPSLPSIPIASIDSPSTTPMTPSQQSHGPSRYLTPTIWSGQCRRACPPHTFRATR